MEAVVGRARAGSVALARAVPMWAWLTCAVVLSAGIRFWLARKIVAPWILVDELIYSELAKSFAATGHFLVRDQATSAYGFVYPVLISPAYRLYAAVPSAYDAARAINSVLMSLAAVPAYFLARRVLPPGWSFAAAVLAILIPSMAYTSTLMTENAFYPAFLLVALALVLVLEQPTWRRQALLLALCAFAFLIRAQAVAFLPAILTAPPLLAWMDGRRRVLREYTVLWTAAVVALVLVPLVQIARGHSPLAVFGAYEKAGHTHYTVTSVLRWLLYHVAELDLYLGVIPFAALLVLMFVSRRLPRRTQVFVAATVALSFWLLLEVAAFASKNPIPPRVEERNMFYLAPLFVIALLVWIDQGMPRRHVGVGVAAVVAAVLPGVLPYSTLIGVPAASDELALSIWWRLQDHTISLAHVATWAVVCAVVAALLFLLVPRRLAGLLPLVVAAIFVAVTWTAMDYTHGFQRAAVGALFQGDTNPHRDWIDRAVGHNANVAVVWTACASQQCPQPRSQTDDKVVWENEFFSRSVGTVYYLHDPLPGGLPERPLTFDAASGYFRSDGALIRAPYVLVDSSVEPVGTVVAKDVTKGTSVYRLHGPLRQAVWIRGLYPDYWSGPRLEYVRRGCTGGLLSVVLQGDVNLISKPSHVVVTSFGERLAQAVVKPLEPQHPLDVTLRPHRGICEASFTTTPTAVPGAGDTRRLGIRFIPSATGPFTFTPRS
ncbi:MAG: glycosyltransferase family 39 protein [Gaiellaceae bacterium]